MSRTLWVLGNFKQNLLHAQVLDHLQALAPATAALRNTHSSLRVGIAPSFVSVQAARAQVPSEPNPVQVLAQNVAAQEQGAYTGEVSAPMLKAVGCDLAIIGHSERRTLFGESDATVAEKVAQCAQAGLGIVLCVGESLAQREAQTHVEVVTQQLKAALARFPQDSEVPLILAYEPVWAIGTGRSATPQQAQEMHAHLREELTRLDPQRGSGRSILYGGSVKPGNAAELLAAGNQIDGFLVGGASLDPTSFTAIAQAASEHLSQ